MLSLIEVRCPHCGAKGQIMVPPPGAIIVAPCPECQELVVVFCGQVLALKKEMMVNSSIREKREHLLSVLTDFLRQRVVDIITDDARGGEVSPGMTRPKASPKTSPQAAPMAATPKAGLSEKNRGHYVRRGIKAAPISPEEIERFRKDDLRLMDNPDYFKAIFG